MSEEINLPPFYIGQKIIALKDHSQDVFKKGDTFIVREMKMKCCGWSVWYGRNMDFPKGVEIEWPCSACGKSTYSCDQRCFFKATLFAPLEETFQEIKIEKILETETKLISSN